MKKYYNEIIKELLNPNLFAEIIQAKTGFSIGAIYTGNRLELFCHDRDYVYTQTGHVPIKEFISGLEFELNLTPPEVLERQTEYTEIEIIFAQEVFRQRLL
jgi:hypothetical protein